ncbi:hypothetical protein BGZ58_000700, partial [Dissophora ornata]
IPEVEEDEVDTNDIVEEEEMDFSITRRPATRLDELFPGGDLDLWVLQGAPVPY